MIELLALTPEELQAWLDVLLNFLSDPLIVGILVSLGLSPLASTKVRQKVGLQKKSAPTDNEVS